MTLEEYIDSLLAQGLDQEEITRLAEEFVANGNKAVEEAKIQDGVMSASAPSIGPQPAQEITMESLLESGFADSLEIDEIERTFENRANGEVAPNSYLIETNQSESEFEKLQKEYFKDSTIDLSPDLTNVGFYNRAAVTKDFFEKNKNTYAEKFINDGSEARAKINDLDLDISDPYEYFGIQDDTFVNDNYNSDYLEAQGISPRGLSGFLRKEGIMQDIKSLDKSGFYDQDNPNKYLSQGAKDNSLVQALASTAKKDEKLALARERQLQQGLQRYMSSLDEHDKEKAGAYFNIENPGNLKGVELVNAINEHKKNTPSRFNSELSFAYNTLQFPLAAQKDDEYLSEKIKEVQRMESEGTIKGALALGDFVKNVGSGVYDEADGFLTSVADYLGADTIAENARMAKTEKQRSKTTALNYARVEGKKATINGIEYIQNSDGQIFNTTIGYNISYTTAPLDYEEIQKALDESTEYGSDWDSRGFAQQAGSVTGGIIFQIAMTRGIGGGLTALNTRALATANGFTSVEKFKKVRDLANSIGGTYGNKVAGSIRLPIKKQYVDLMVFQSMYGASLGYEETLRQGRASGLSISKSEELASRASQQMMLLFAATAPLNPRTKATEAIFGKSVKSKITQAMGAYSETGSIGFMNSLSKSVRQLQLTDEFKKYLTKGAKGAATFTEEGSKEVVQENIQQLGEYTLINPSINEMAGTDFLKDTYTLNDIKVTTALSFLTAGGIANVKLPGNSGSESLNQLRAFYSLGQNYESLQKNVNDLIIAGKMTEKQGNKLLTDSRAVFIQLDKMPANIDESIVMEASRLLMQIQDIEVSKSNTDPAFHGPDNQKLKVARQSLEDLYINQDITRAQKAMKALGLKGETKAAESDQEFQDYLKTLVDEDGNRQYTDEAIKEASRLGVFVDSTGDIVINKAAARRMNESETGRHEFLHRLIYTTVKGKPELIAKIGKDLDSFVEQQIENGNITGGKKFKANLRGYKNRVVSLNDNIEKLQGFLDSGKLDTETEKKVKDKIEEQKGKLPQLEANAFEETLTLLSESIASGDIVYEKDQDFIVKVGDYIRNFLQSVGLQDINLKDGKATFNFIRDYNKAFDKTEFNRAFKKLANTKADPNAKDSVFIKESQKERNEEVDILVGPKDSDGNYIMTKSEWDAGGIANAYMDIIAGTKLDGLIRRGIEGDMVYGKPIEVFIEDVKQGLPGAKSKSPQGLMGTLSRFNPEKSNSLMGWINGQMAERKGDVLIKYKKEAPLSSKSLDVKAGEVGSVMEIAADETAEDFITREEKMAAQEAAFKKAPSFLEALPVDQTLGETSYKEDLIEEVDKRIKRNIQFFDSNTSSNRTVKPFIAEVKKDISDNFYKPTKKWINNYEGGYEGFLKDFRTDLLNNYTTTYLSKHPIFRKGILKRINGKWTPPTKVISSYGGFKYDWVDKKGKKLKIDRDDAANRNMTSGPEFIKRNPNILNILDENEFIDYHFEDGANRTKKKQNPEDALAKQLASEIGFEILQSDLLTTNENGETVGGPLTQAIIERAGLLEMVFADNAMITLASDLDRGNVKESFKMDPAKVKPIYEKGLDILAEQGDVAFNDFIDGLPNQEAAQYVKKYFDDKLWQVGMYQTAKARNRGIAYEKLVKRVLSASGNKKIKVSLIGNDKKLGGDILLSFEGVNIPIELKLNDFAQMGSFTISQSENESSFTLKGIDPATKNIIDDALKSRQPALDKYFEAAQEFADKKGYTIEVKDNVLRAPKKVHQYLRAKGFLSNTNLVVKLDQDIIAKLYNSKGVYYINIGNKGLFALGEDINKLGVPILYSDVNLNIRLTRSNDSKFGRRATTRAFPTLTGNLITSAKSLDNPREVKELLSNMQDSVKESQKQESDEIANVGMSNDINLEFNKMIEGVSGISATESISEARGRLAGQNKRGTWFVPYSHEDFVGLMYPLLSKGKKGEQQYDFIKKTIIRPYAEAEYKINQERLSTAADFEALKEQINSKKIRSKRLNKVLKKKAWENFTNEDALRVWLWNMQGMDIPKLNDSDIASLVAVVKNNRDLVAYGFGIKSLMKGNEYPEPGRNWEVGNVSYDIQQNLETTRRKSYLRKWQENVDIAFSKDNRAKLEASFGPKYVEALDNILKRMQTGRNRSTTNSRLENSLLDYINGSVSAIMAINTKSAVLQQLSNINFLNATDNNPYAAAKAFGNQPQYWRDVIDILNSDYLVNRRAGLKINVTESELAEAANSPNKVKAIIGLIGEKGFILTKYGDSFAIASGGATFYRNRYNTYLNETDTDGNKLYTKEQAEKKATVDFIEISEDTQQSSRPDKISMQQAGNLGRLLLAFANTPSQYARLTKKALLDLKDGRGSKVENIAKITYYGFVQNLIFSFMQQGLFSILFDDNDDEDDSLTIKEKEAIKGNQNMKAFKAANGGFDGFLRGLGIMGGATSMLKNMGIKLYEKSKKPRPKYAEAAYEILNVSPPIDSKISKIKGGLSALDYDLEEMKEKGWKDITNPGYMASARVIAGTTNIGVDRLFTKGKNIKNALNSQLAIWQRTFSLLGWQGYELGIEEDEWETRDIKSMMDLNLDLDLDLKLPKIKF